MVLEPEIPLDVMEIGGGRRLAVAKDALSMEVRAGGVWARARVIPYDDIRALYRFQSTDWAGLSIIAVLWVVLLLALLIAAATLHWSAGLTIASTAVLTLLAVILGIVRGRMAPARLLRIEAYSGPLQIAERSTTFYSSLSAQLRPGPAPAAAPPPATVAPAAPPAEAVVNEPPAAPIEPAASDHPSPPQI